MHDIFVKVDFCTPKTLIKTISIYQHFNSNMKIFIALLTASVTGLKLHTVDDYPIPINSNHRNVIAESNNWRELETEDGLHFYYNVVTEEVVWKPGEMRAPAPEIIPDVQQPKEVKDVDKKKQIEKHMFWNICSTTPNHLLFFAWFINYFAKFLTIDNTISLALGGANAVLVLATVVQYIGRASFLPCNNPGDTLWNYPVIYFNVIFWLEAAFFAVIGMNAIDDSLVPESGDIIEYGTYTLAGVWGVSICLIMVLYQLAALDGQRMSADEDMTCPRFWKGLLVIFFHPSENTSFRYCFR